jgi:hypothetical protein
VLLAIDNDAAVVDAYRQAGIPTLHPGSDRPR